MSNFTNFQTSRTTNTSWRNRSYSLGSKPYDSSRGISLSNTVDYSNTANISNKQHSNRPNIRQRTGSVTTSTTSSLSGSSHNDSGVTNARKRNQLSQPRPHFAARLSSNSSNDGGYLWANKNRRHSNSYRQCNEQRMSNTWSLEVPQLDSGSTSSTESGVFSGDSSGGDIPPVNSGNDRKNYLNFPLNQRNSRGFSKYPPGMPIPTPSTHFASSENFNAPAPSSLPQPPQIWLFGRAEAQDKEEDLEEERVQEKNLNTFDYYNLKMLLTVKA